MDDLARRRLAAVLAVTGLSGQAAAAGPQYGHLPPLAPGDLWSPLPRRTVRVDVGGIPLTVAYVDSGAPEGDPGNPPIVLVHGLSSWTAFWEHQIPAFARTRRVLALDLAGHGASDRPDAPYTMAWHADVVFAWLDALGVDRAVWCGHSMGGQIALTAALAAPERVASLVLAAPAGIERFDAAEAEWLTRFYSEDRTYDTAEDELATSFRTLVFNRVDDGVERFLRERVQMRGTPGLRGLSRAVSRSIAGMLRGPVYERLPELVPPALVVFGTDDRLIPNPVFHPGPTEAIARLAHQRIGRCEQAMIHGAGHTVHHDAPELFNRVVARFLR